MLIRSMFRETTIQIISSIPASRCRGHGYGRTYAGARVVFRKVDLQILHWISLACSLTFSCDLATPFSSLSLRARFEAAFAPCWWSVSLIPMGGMEQGKLTFPPPIFALGLKRVASWVYSSGRAL
jgi:hypothetical protein